MSLELWALTLCLASVLINVGLLAIQVKPYTEILKIDHIKRIGK